MTESNDMRRTSPGDAPGPEMPAAALPPEPGGPPDAQPDPRREEAPDRDAPDPSTPPADAPGDAPPMPQQAPGVEAADASAEAGAEADDGTEAESAMTAAGVADDHGHEADAATDAAADRRGRRTGFPVVVDDASLDFGEGVGVHDLQFEVPRGEILGIVGPSGSGKTTTIRLLTGALEPDSGEVRVLGEDPRRFRRSTRELIGYMPQLFTLYRDLTTKENVDFVASLFGMLFPRRRRRTREVLELVELWSARKRRAGDLSGGMQRRLELACALVHQPELLFLDEPTAGIDPLLRRTIWDEIHRLKSEGKTLLVTTQYVGEAEECDRVALIADGRLAALDTPAALRRQAIGGDLLEVQTAGPFDPAPLLGRRGVREVSSIGVREFRMTVDDGAATLPIVDDLVAEVGGEVVAASQVRPSFDEVFAVLVKNGNGVNGTGRDGGDGGPSHEHDTAEAAA